MNLRWQMTNKTVALIMMAGIMGLVIYLVRDMTSDKNDRKLLK